MVPSPGSFSASSSVSSCISQTSAISVTACTITTNQVTMQVTNTSIQQSFQVNVLNFKNPSSTQTITGITATLTTSTGTSKATGSNGVINSFQPDLLNAASITPVSLLIGDQASSITVSLTPKNTLTANGRIYMDFPYWNPLSSNKIHSISSTTPTCIGVSNMKTSITCSYNQINQRLTLTNIINSDITGGSTTISFKVDSFINPYSGVPKTGFVISTADSNGYQVDQKTGLTVTVTDWASFFSATFDRSDSITTVDELSQGIVLFQLDLPVEQNCRLRIDFPSDQPLTSDLQTYQGANLFSTLSLKTFNLAGNYIEIDGCPDSMSDAMTTGFVQLYYILNANQVKTTQTFQYSLYAISNSQTYKIARKTTDIMIQSTQLQTGSITTFKVSAVDSTVIQTTTKYQITLKPEHSIATSSVIIISFPSSITLTDQPSCSLSSVSGGISTSPGSCVVSGNVLTITNAFGTGSYTKNGAALSFIFSTGGTNPSVVQDAGTFSIKTYAIISGTQYSIDSKSFTNVYSPTPSILKAIVSAVSSTITGISPSSYTLQITPDKTIPQSGLIIIQFPTDITLPSGQSAPTSCKVNIDAEKTVTYTVSSTSPITLTITDAFSSKSLVPTGSSFTVILAGLQNPRTTDTTGSFTMTTSSSDGSPIEAVSSGVTTKMTANPDLISFTVTPLNQVNGFVTQYTVTVKSAIAMKTGDKLQFAFPTEITLPSTPTCSIGSQIISLVCSKTGSNSLKVVLTFGTSPLSAGTSFTFLVNSLTNPPSTTPTTNFTSIVGYDTSDKQIQQYSGTVTITTATPATVATSSLSQANQNVGIATAYTITYTAINPMPSGSAFLITYPATVSPASSLTTCQVIYSGVTYLMSGCTVDTSTKTIYIPTGFSSTVSIGGSIKIILSPITNPIDSLNTDTFTLTSYTSSAYLYSIDQILSGLIPSFACTLPCKTCSATSKTSCVSCFTATASITQKYLSGNTCVVKCPAGTFGDSNFICQACPSTCKTCSDIKTCLTCNTGGSYPNFLNGNCVTTCPDGNYNQTFTCKNCSSTCKTCSIAATNCTSCNGTTPFLSNNKCQGTCDAGYVSQNYQCQKCIAPCATCLVTQSTCTSCTTGNLYGTTCISTCPNGTTFLFGKCIGCDPLCSVCSPLDTNQCLVCKTGYVVINSTCFTSCPEGFQKDPTNTTCIMTYIPQAVAVNASISVKETNIYDKTFIYFPFAIAQLILGGISVGSWFKDKSSIIPSNCIALWGVLEFLAYVAQIGLSYVWITNTAYSVDSSTSVQISANTNGKRFLATPEYITYFDGNILPIVFYGTCFALIMLIIMNLAFFVLYLVFIKKDPGYIQHNRKYCFTSTIIAVIGSLLSFKVGNFLYSRFFGLQSCAVPFEEAAKLHTMLNIMSIINIVFSILPIIFIDVYGLLKYHWGSQFYLIIIETLMLSISMFGFTIWEFRAQKQVLKPSESEQMVYAAVGDQSSIEDQVMKRMEEEIRKRFGGQTMEEFIENLKNQRAIENAAYGDKKLKRGNSMIDLGDRTKEEDDRRVNTDPLDSKQRKKFDKCMNLFEYDKYPDNCYAEPGESDRTPLDPSRIATKVIQYGEYALNGEDYDKEYEKNIRELFHGKNPADERGDSRYLSKFGNDILDEDLMGPTQRKKNRLRGRKGKYYEQVDDEDESFLQDQENMLKDDEEDEEDEEKKLDMIEEESHNTLDHDEDKLNKLEDQIIKDEIQLDETQKLNQSILEAEDSIKLLEENHETQFFEIEDAVGEEAIIQQDENLMSVPPEENLMAAPQDEILELPVDLDIDEPEAMVDIPIIEEAPVAAIHDEEEEEEVIKNLEEMGEPDSDDDDDQRIANMRDLDKKRFNVNDILGEFDRDDRGNLVILQENKTGNLIDKDGNRVNEKGYLIDEKTGDVVEKERGKKVFDAKELDERGELPPPFNLERFNFNIHDVRGYFDRDADGNEIIGNRKDGLGKLVDKHGRRVNEHGYLVDEIGNLVDKRGRMKLHNHIMQQNNGDLPLLFNYKGKKFDVTDIMGDLDKDRNGNIIIRRDKDNQMVDKKGRRVNNKGYLIDQNGNVVNKNGKVMFDVFSLSKDNEIPKLFPFLKFNIDDIKGDYEMDPLGNPMLQKTRDGDLVDSKGRKVNEKGYLLDEDGHIRNKRGYKVFNKNLLEDGDIPKVFRTGLLRKDTYDSFSQLMSEIEDLERMQEMDIDDPRRQAMKNKMAKENERLQKRIDKIVEEDNDDDDLLMREVENLANGHNSDGDGGNTSVESQMEDTPSNYNALNQRFNEVEDIRNQARRNLRNQQRVPEDDEFESEYSYLPGKKLKKKKKKKKKVKKEQEIDLRELKMAVAYGGLSQAQYDKIVATKKLRDAQNMASQMGATSTSQIGAKPPIQRNASNVRMNTVQSKRGQIGVNNRQGSAMGDDLNSEFGGAESVIINPSRKPPGLSTQMQQVTSTSRMPSSNMNKTTSRLNKDGIPTYHQMRKNNLMSDKGDMQSEASDKQQKQLFGNDRDRRLSQIANSVSGFYKEGSDHSLMRSTHESNFAQNLGKNRRGPGEEMKQPGMRKAPDTAGFGMRGVLGGTANDPELDRIYGTARGLADLTQLSDWEKDSQRSGKSARSQFPAMNTLKVRGLENIYLQRLEPASKGRKTAMKKGEDKAKFRVMHHKHHDEPEWYVDDQRDELDSVISDNYKQMEKRFVKEFQGTNSGGKKKGIKDKSGINIFTGKLNQYKEKARQEQLGGIDFNRQN